MRKLISRVLGAFRPRTLTVPHGIAALARALEASWPERIAAIRATGAPMATYNNVISRADAAATIPEEVSDVLLKGVMNEAAALELFGRIPVARGQTRLPIISALPVAYWVNGDTGLKQTSEVNWANKYLNIEELAVIVPIPEAVLDDSSIDVWGQVRPLTEQAIARAFDAAVFFGVNAPASFPDDVVTAAAAAGNVIARGTNAANVGGIVSDFSDLYGTVEGDGYDPDGLIAGRGLKGRLRRAKGTSGNNTDEDFLAELRNDATFPMRGLWPTGASAAEAIAFQRDQFVVGVRQDFTYKILDQAVIQDADGNIVYNLAQQDMVAMRVVFRAGWQVANVINYDQAVEADRYPAGVLTAPA